MLGFSACKKAEMETTAETFSAKNHNLALNAASLNAAEEPAFKALSFNVRHNDAADPQSITQRQGMIKQIIIDNNPDVFGLQEFSDNSFESWFRAEMTPLGYGEYYDTAITGTPKAIFYKNSRFNKLNQGTVKIGPTNTATWVILQDKQTGNKYFISNSHWQFDSQAVRIDNANALVAGVNQFNTENLPEIVFGDFNAKPGTTEIGILKSGLDVVDALGDSDGEFTFHSWNATGSSKLDWMTSTRNLAYTSSEVIKTSYNGNWPSDHWPVMAVYRPAVFGAAHEDNNGISASAATNYYFADVNGDGKKDKIYWRSSFDSGIPQVFLSNGNGTFASPAIKHTAGASALASSCYYYADVNGDGKADEIVWNPTQNAGRTRVYLATSNGNFSSTAIENPEGTSQGATTVYHFADVNGDGKADKIYWNATFDSGKTRVYLATSNGNFSSSVVAGTEGASTTGATRFWYADINGDTRADKILWHANLNGGKTMVYLSDGDGTFTLSNGFSDSATSGLDNTRFYFADINGDGRADKIYWNPTNYLGKVKVYWSTTANTFSGPVYSLRGTSQSENTIFYFTDINGDSKADQVRWNYAENSGALRNYYGE
ncbi:endonuclease [Pedobacter sp. BMA]|nr:endonuclease [Pedobacter sp. BMA]